MGKAANARGTKEERTKQAIERNEARRIAQAKADAEYKEAFRLEKEKAQKEKAEEGKEKKVVILSGNRVGRGTYQRTHASLALSAALAIADKLKTK